MQKQVGAATIEIIQGDITGLAVDAIVNAANTHLQHGGGVAAAIARKGGPVIQKESDAIIAARGPLQTGEAAITSGGHLPARFVIHTAGPIWGNQTPQQSDEMLRDSIRNSLRLADEKQIKSIAFPAISTGIYHFPIERAARLMLQQAHQYLAGTTSLQRVVFCVFDADSHKAFAKALAEI